MLRQGERREEYMLVKRDITLSEESDSSPLYSSRVNHAFFVCHAARCDRCVANRQNEEDTIVALGYSWEFAAQPHA